MGEDEFGHFWGTVYSVCQHCIWIIKPRTK